MEHLAEGNAEEALRIAGRLIRKKDPGGHELRVSALLEGGAVEEAVRAAEEGVACFPDSWMLHNTLGLALARFECPEDAAGAFERALLCEDVDASEVSINLAAVRGMQGDWESCLEILHNGEDWGEYEMPRLFLQCDALLGLERWSDALTFAQATRREWGDDLDPDALGMLLGTEAMATLQGGGSCKRAVRLAWQALHAAPSQARALEVIRIVDDTFSPTSRLFEVECAVELDGQDGEVLTFCSSYLVIADLLDDAYTYIQRYEEQVSGGSPVIADFEDHGPAPLEACGVVEVLPVDTDDGEASAAE